jgi:low affinity Fe/Cu permease
MAARRKKAKTEEADADKSASLFTRVFTHFANAVARITGKPVTFVLCCAVIIVWAVTGPLFHYSDTWQLIINTGTTIVTFLMVFLIQNTQNRDGAAIQAKLDELIRALEGARNNFIGIEHLTDLELERIRNACEEEVKGGGETEKSRKDTHHAKSLKNSLGRLSGTAPHQKV